MELLSLAHVRGSYECQQINAPSSLLLYLFSFVPVLVVVVVARPLPCDTWWGCCCLICWPSGDAGTGGTII